MALSFIIPGLNEATSEKVIGILQERLSQEQEAALVLKHAHWNVAGPNFIAVHEMLDPQVDEVLAMADETAERIAALGGSPSGRPDDIVPSAHGTSSTLTDARTRSTICARSTNTTMRSSRTTAPRSRSSTTLTSSARTSSRTTCRSLSSSSGSCVRI